jgi:5'-3' exoribonuclease 1
MGIPYFFKALTDRHRDLIVPWSGRHRVGRLFLDYNCLIHQCANIVASTPCYRDIDLYNLVIQNTLFYTQQVVQMVNPQSLVYIAVDGPCPRAKMQQQRKRRYLAAWKTEMFPPLQQTTHHQQLPPQHQHQQICKWDSNVVTPGTEFMHLLMHHLTLFIKQQNAFRQHHKTPSYILTTSDEFGEGEHKIFHYLDSHPPKHHNQIDLVYGLDADLILLSLLRTNHNIMLLREAQNFNTNNKHGKHNNYTPFLLFNTTRLRQYINIPLHDYVILCSLLGNDFVPPLSYLKIKDHALDQIMTAYHNARQTLSTDLVINGNLNMPFFALILRDLAKAEQTMLKEAVEKLFKTSFDRADPEAYPLLQPQPFDLDDPQWRSHWYHYLFGKSNSKTVKTACREYLNGIIWTLKYYTSSPETDFSWYYPFHYSPTISDLAVYSQTVDIPYTFNLQKHNTFVSHVNPWIQQLLIMPPKTFTPQQTILASKLPHYYPSNFQVATFLKRFLWECGVHLPEVDFERVLAESNKIRNSVK